MQQMVDMTQQNVCGVVRLELFKGNCRVTGRKSDRSLYREDFATFEDDEVYSHKDGRGLYKIERPAAAHPEDAGTGSVETTRLPWGTAPRPVADSRR